MSKIDELRVKYPSVTKVSFEKFVEADKTPTKKYLDYMLKIWSTRDIQPVSITSTKITQLVKLFDELLPFITNKDIYSVDYSNFSTLSKVVDNAEIARDEKSFVRKEHVNVLMENDDYMLVQPKTHKGSLKYGANTRWCTASKKDPEVFKRYNRNGFLVYLIDKTGTKQKNYEKIALYMEYHSRPLNDYISFFNAYDTSVTETAFASGGWTLDEMFSIIGTYRYCYMKYKAIKNEVDSVQSFIKTLNALDFTSFEQSLLKLELTTNTDYISEAKESVNKFLDKIKNSKYATIRETKN
jgi:hypothetical protein